MDPKTGGWEIFDNTILIKTEFYFIFHSKNAKQKGKPDEGVRGFLPKDINWILQEYKKHKCTYCKKNMATSICEFKGCNQRFHYTCAMQHGGKVQFHK